MPTQAINNSVIRSVTWNEGDLIVEFKRGSRYRYAGVPVDHYYKICVSKKAIKYYRDHIKGKFIASKIKLNQQIK